MSLIVGFPPRRLRHLCEGSCSPLRALCAGQSERRGLEHAGCRLADLGKLHLQQSCARWLVADHVCLGGSDGILLGNKAAQFDLTKFSWLGSLSQDVIYCGVWQRPGVAASIEEMMTTETIIGSTSPAAITYQHPMILRNVLKANIKVISGYPGTREISLAMLRGEVNGVAGSLAHRSNPCSRPSCRTGA